MNDPMRPYNFGLSPFQDYQKFENNQLIHSFICSTIIYWSLALAGSNLALGPSLPSWPHHLPFQRQRPLSIPFFSPGIIPASALRPCFFFPSLPGLGWWSRRATGLWQWQADLLLCLEGVLVSWPGMATLQACHPAPAKESPDQAGEWQQQVRQRQGYGVCPPSAPAATHSWGSRITRVFFNCWHGFGCLEVDGTGATAVQSLGKGDTQTLKPRVTLSSKWGEENITRT